MKRAHKEAVDMVVYMTHVFLCPGKGDYRSALKETFLSLDKRLQDGGSTVRSSSGQLIPVSVAADPSLNFQFEPGGTTAVAVLVKDNTLFCVSRL